MVSLLSSISHKPTPVLKEMVQTGITGFCLNWVIFEKKKSRIFGKMFWKFYMISVPRHMPAWGSLISEAENDFQKTLHILTNFVILSMPNANVVGNNIKLNFRAE